jgi:soluble lytic murein transglycosylase-like protein
MTAGGGGLLVLAPPLTVARMLAIDARRARFAMLIDDVAQAHDLDPDLLCAVVQVESGFDPSAVSPRGAIGLMQLMPATAASLGLADASRLLHEPEINLHMGALYLSQQLRRFGALDLAMAAYNAGEGAVMRYGGNFPPYPETRAYVRDVLALYAQLQAARRPQASR